MSKISKQFKFVTPYGGSATVKPIEIKIEGVGYNYGMNEHNEMVYDFDINDVYFDGQCCTNFFKWIVKRDASESCIEYINEVTYAHIAYLFSSSYEDASLSDSTDIEQDTPTSAVQSLQNGNFSSSNLFAAIGEICRGYNTQILNNQIQ